MVQNDKKILLHACCGICSAYPISYLKDLGYEPVVYFYNPNLDSLEEFSRRLEAQKKVCEYYNVQLLVENYNPEEFLSFVIGLENEPEKGRRCDKCIDLRLRKTCEKSVELDIPYFTTSLVISPHKNFEKISELGKGLSNKYLAVNFRKKDGFLKTNLISKELGLYRQSYCGCKFSKQK